MTSGGPQRLLLDGLGTTLGVVVEDLRLHGLLEDAFREVFHHDVPSRPPAALVVVLGSGPWDVCSPGHTATCGTAELTLGAVLAAVNLTFVATTPLLAMHSAVVSRGDRTVAIPATSGGGKSTLTAALLRRGWDYVSDEALCLRWDGSLVGYPRPMALSIWSANTVSAQGPLAAGEVVVRARDLGSRVAASPPPVTDVVLLDRDGSSPALHPVAGQVVVAELLRRSFTHFLDPDRTLRLLAGLAASARCWQLRLGDPNEAAQVLDTTLLRPSSRGPEQHQD